jgi:Ca-activated chloride channel homolog
MNMRDRRRKCFTAAVAFLGFLSFGYAQRENLTGLRLRVDAGLVLIPVTVTDRRGAVIGDLRKDSFTILDEGQPQQITAFYREEAPVSVGIVLDMSGSIRDRINLEKAAVKALLDASNPDDDFFLATVSSNPGTLSTPTHDVREIEDLLRAEAPGGATALCDTIHSALVRMHSRQKQRAALLVISDGMDNHSRHSKSEVMSAAMESDAQVYTLAVGGAPYGAKGLGLEEIRRGLAFMEDLAEKSGGLSVRLSDYDNPQTAAGTISRAFHNQYVVGYRSLDGGMSGKWHRVQVKVKLDKANVYARSGYRSQ